MWKPNALRSARLQVLESTLKPSPSFITTRSIQTTSSDKAPLTVTESSDSASPNSVAYPPPTAPSTTGLECLPLSQVLRTYLITALSSSPTVLQACSSVLMRMLESKSFLTSAERNPLLRLVLRETFYKQFCAGANKAEVQATMKKLHNIGYNGIILEYALEVLREAKDADEIEDVEVWRKGMLDSITVANPGDFIGLKWSGMGPHALERMKAHKPPTERMESAMREVCDLAAAKGVALLPSAEETNTAPAYHEWTMNLQRKYNKERSRPVLYNTYQLYLRGMPAELSKHLASAKRDGHVLGVKLVRGAYLSSEPKHLLWPTAEATHAAYDSVAEAVLKRQYVGLVQPVHGDGSEGFPEVDLVLATHNAVSVRKAQALRTEQVQQGVERIPLSYAQLQGMADEVSCELIQASKASNSDKKIVEVPRVFKCTTWGTMTQCLNYLLRRAAENKDAASRTRESRVAMGKEMRRRLMALFGLA